MERRSALKALAAGLLTTAEACLPDNQKKTTTLHTPGTPENKKSPGTPQPSPEKLIKNNFADALVKLETRFGLKKDEYAVIIDPSCQKLFLLQNGAVVKDYPVSTGKKGVGTVSGSEKTPFGTHRIKEKMGQGEKLGTILVGEGNKNGTVTQIISEKADTPFDYVTTRLLRLDGQESGINRGGANDSHSRDIYIHGTPEEGLLGTPASHGCIRMKNSDIIALFDLLPSGTLVEILPKEFEPTPAMLSKTK